MLVGCGRFGFDAHRVELAAPDAAVPGDGDPVGDGDATSDGDAAGDGDAGNPAGDGDMPGVDAGDGPLMGVGDAGPGDAGPSVNPPRECADYLVCSGFEGTPDETPYASRTALLSTLGTDQDTVHSGSYSLRAATVQEGDAASAVFSLSPRSSGDLYARVWVFAPLGTFVGRINTLYLGSVDNDGGLDVNINADGAVDLYFRHNDVRFVSDGGHVPQTRWFCLQVHLTLSDTEGGATVSIDGEELIAGSGTLDTVPSDGLRSLVTGINWTEAGQSTTLLYVDDVALDTSPVPCE